MYAGVHVNAWRGCSVNSDQLKRKRMYTQQSMKEERKMRNRRGKASKKQQQTLHRHDFTCVNM